MNQQQAKMLKQLQQMQQNVAAAQEKLAGETVEASAGGGTVTAVMSGDLVLKELRINPEAVDPEDVEMLQDLVTAAVNEALRSAQEADLFFSIGTSLQVYPIAGVVPLARPNPIFAPPECRPANEYDPSAPDHVHGLWSPALS